MEPFASITSSPPLTRLAHVGIPAGQDQGAAAALGQARLVGRGIGQLAGEPGNTFFRDPVFELQGGLDRIDIAVGNAKRRGVDLGLEFPADADGNPLVIGIRRVARQILAILYTRKELRQHGSRHGIVLDRLILGREFLRPDSDRELLQCRDCAATQSVEVSALPIVRIPARHARLPGLPAIDLGLILLFLWTMASWEISLVHVSFCPLGRLKSPRPNSWAGPFMALRRSTSPSRRIRWDTWRNPPWPAGHRYTAYRHSQRCGLDRAPWSAPW